MNIAANHRDTILHYPKTGETDWGDPTFGAAQTLPARVEKKQSMVRSPGGNAQPSDTQIEVGSTPEIKAGDRVDAQYGDGARDVMNVDMIKDFWSNVLGWKVYL